MDNITIVEEGTARLSRTQLKSLYEYMSCLMEIVRDKGLNSFSSRVEGEREVGRETEKGNRDRER